MGEVIQMDLFKKTLDKRAKREAARILRSYGTLDALIQSMSVEMPEPNMTVNYQPSESQRSNQFYSSTETIAVKRYELELKQAQKEKLDIIYNSIDQTKKDIWNLRFIDDYTDEQVMIKLHMSNHRNKYFGEKYELMGMIADSFYLW